MGALLGAVAFAAVKHQDQRRKGHRRLPYINHPVRVAEILWSVGGVRDMTTLVAALLHDTLEDTETTPAEIELHFGSEVLAVVQEVTDDKSLPKAVRKQHQVERAAYASPRAKIIKLADKIRNVSDLVNEPPADWPKPRIVAYVDWSELVVAGLRGVNPRLEAMYDDVVRAAHIVLAASNVCHR
ncbi:MAG: bifunctional (p)ppGpp synthetase/guanosine-3',5'-bis(diphosphate) 3'-pyrophosphohydrolase [Anaerolineae bacterium]|nr:bifunctional (p)ppGpp synthetase/guanosine-3',5'-bis(diphosphate) 3'-pyrophosphohydrolase [Anaerolineae bacterium]